MSFQLCRHFCFAFNFIVRIFARGVLIVGILFKWVGIDRANAQAIKLEYLNSVVLPSNSQIMGTRIGGLSGLSKGNDAYWAISDDKGKFGAPRLYDFAITLNETEFLVKPRGVLFLKNKKKVSFGKRVFDLEGIAEVGKSFLVISEGLFSRKPKEMPTIMEFDRSGVLKNEILVPRAFLPEKIGKPTRGVRSNGAFEGISVSPDGDQLWVITEQPLYQDIPDWKAGDAGFLRLLQYRKSSKDWVQEQDWKYPIESLGTANSTGGMVIAHGASEILAIGQREALVLERGAITRGFEVVYVIKLWQISIPLAGLDKVSSQLDKQLVFDFKSVESRVPDGKGLDNLEGMSWGPEVQGHKTLIFVSDDNFAPLQRTIWVALKTDFKAK